MHPSQRELVRALLLLTLLLALFSGCVWPSAFQITYDGERGTYTAVAIDARHLGSLHHGEILEGHTGDVLTVRGRVPFVVKSTHGEVVELVTETELRHGDSGSGCVGSCGALLAVVKARRP